MIICVERLHCNLSTHFGRIVSRLTYADTKRRKDSERRLAVVLFG